MVCTKKNGTVKKYKLKKIDGYYCDGTKWNNITEPSNSYVSIYYKSPIAYGDGKFVTVSYKSVTSDNHPNSFSTSTDGITWTTSQSMNSTYNYGFDDIAYGNGKFIAIGPYVTSYKTLAVSNNGGRTWTVSTINIAKNLHNTCITYNDDLNYFVFIAGDTRVYSDKNGYFASLNSSSPVTNTCGIAYGNGRYVVIGQQGECAVVLDFQDNTTISTGTLPTSSYEWSAITYGNGVFVATDTHMKKAVSTDGINWRVTYDGLDYNYADCHGIAFGDGKFVAIGYYGHTQISSESQFTSTFTLARKKQAEGLTWSTAVQDANLNETNVLEGMCYGKGKFVGIDYYGKITTSNDGISWSSLVQAINDNRFSDIIYDGSKFIAIQYDSSGLKIYISTDYTNWERYSSSYNNESNARCCCAYGNGKYVAISSGGYLFTSSDLLTWSRTQNSNLGSRSWTRVTYGNGKFVAIGHNGYISTSTDGTTWSTSSYKFNRNWYSIVYANNKYIALSTTGYISTSTDGETWSTPTQLVENKSWFCMASNGNKLAATGHSGYVSTCDMTKTTRYI